MDLGPTVEELFTDENNTEEVRVWPIKYTKTILCLACKLPLQLFPHFQGDTDISLFSLYFWALLLWGNGGGKLQGVTNEVSQLFFHDETATSLENTALFLGGILSLALCYTEPSFLLFFILGFRGGRFRGFQASQQESFFFFFRPSADSHHCEIHCEIQVRLCFQLIHSLSCYKFTWTCLPMQPITLMLCHQMAKPASHTVVVSILLSLVARAVAPGNLVKQ